MSGGYFDYEQYKITQIADEVERLIDSNEKPDNYGCIRIYNSEVIAKFKLAVDALRTAEIYANRIDWLVSGDDGEDSFLERLQKELA